MTRVNGKKPQAAFRTDIETLHSLLGFGFIDYDRTINKDGEVIQLYKTVHDDRNIRRDHPDHMILPTIGPKKVGAPRAQRGIITHGCERVWTKPHTGTVRKDRRRKNMAAKQARKRNRR